MEVMVKGVRDLQLNPAPGQYSEQGKEKKREHKCKFESDSLVTGMTAAFQSKVPNCQQIKHKLIEELRGPGYYFDTTESSKTLTKSSSTQILSTVKRAVS